METYENNTSWQPVDNSQPLPEPGPAKRVSPFADSPYVMAFADVESEQHGAVEIPVKKEKKGFKPLVAAVLVLGLVVGSCSVTAFLLNQSWQKKTDTWMRAMNNKLATLQAELNNAQWDTDSGAVTAPADGVYTPAQVYARNVDAVVAVTTDVSMGSGFIVSEDGYIISNQHVIDGASKISVVMHDGTEYTAQLVGQDATNDVSLLKIDASELPTVTIGSSDKLVVGAQVAAIGNPLGELTATLTVGYISAKDRVVTTDGTTINMLQTDAAINSGNSGGPLFDMYGNVIGITSAKYSGTSTSGATIEGIGFAIPIDDVIGIVEDLREYGYVKTAYLGVYVRDVEPSVIQNYGFPAGAYVEDVMAGLCAAEAGVRAKDIIINIGGYDVTSVSELTRVLRKFEAGDTTTITVFRSGSEVNLNITMGDKPQDTETSQPETTLPDFGFNNWWEDFPFFGQG